MGIVSDCGHCQRIAAPCFVHDTAPLPYINLREPCRCVNHRRDEHGPSDPRMEYSDFLGACLMQPCGCKGFTPMMERGNLTMAGDAAVGSGDRSPGDRLENTKAPSQIVPLCHRCGAPDGPHNCQPAWMTKESERDDLMEPVGWGGRGKHSNDF